MTWSHDFMFPMSYVPTDPIKKPVFTNTVEVMFSISQSLYIDLFQMEIPARGVINRYIAAQGPLEKTCGDFWQVII